VRYTLSPYIKQINFIFKGLIYINDLPMTLNKTSLPALFVDDTSILFTHHDIKDLNMNMNNTCQIVNKWFKSNLLSLHYEKTQCIQFSTKKFYTK
jgi:hypothetical protein